MIRIDLKTDPRSQYSTTDVTARATPLHSLTTCVLCWRAREGSCHRSLAKPNTMLASAGAEPQVDEAFPLE